MAIFVLAHIIIVLFSILQFSQAEFRQGDLHVSSLERNITLRHVITWDSETPKDKNLVMGIYANFTPE